jgi:rhodanese-related sulfurtransferase
MLKEVDPKQAYEILETEEKAVLIDVRSTMEYQFVGHAPNSIHVPLKEPPDWETTQNYVDNVKKALQEQFPDMQEFSDIPLLMLCRSGARSATGGEMLINAGYTNVYNVLEGFEGDKDENGHRNTINGWRFQGLPWEQS